MRRRRRITNGLGAPGASVLVLALVLSASNSHAQDAAADTTQSALERAIAEAERQQQAEAEADSLTDVVADQSDSTVSLLTNLSQTIGASYSADVTRATTGQDASSTATWRGGGSTTLRWGSTQTGFRQQDRDEVKWNVDGTHQQELFGGTKLNLTFRRDDSETETKQRSSVIRLEQANQRGSAKLEGASQVVEGIQHRWILHGQALDAELINRGTPNNRTLLEGGFRSAWVRTHRDWKLQGHYSRAGATGERTLVTSTADATATLDTLGAVFELDRGERWRLLFTAERISFLEERLEPLRNSSGLVDTTGVPDDEKVGLERESRRTNAFDLTASARPWNALGIELRADHSFTETQFVFSPQGILQRGRSGIEGEATLAYAASGSLGATLRFSDSYDDRRTRDSDNFRGKESVRNYEARFFLDQRLFPQTDLAFDVRQTLRQNVNEEATNNRDLDRLVDRADATISSKALPQVTLNVGATASRTREINIDAERVGNNKEDTLVEVRGGYTWDPGGNLRLVQNYRLQIVFLDFIESIDRDQFNKQGQWTTDLSYLFSSGPSIGVSHVADFRKNGNRDVDELFAERYLRTLRRSDHQLRANVTVPWRGYELRIASQRAFLREETGGTEKDENRGQVSFKLRGNQSFWSKRATLSIDLERILQFGPRVREEQEDYWVANTSIKVTF